MSAYGSFGIGIDPESELRGETHSAKNAQGIFLQADIGVVDAADNFVSQVVLSVKGIYKAADWMERHCIDGEIASRQILLDGVDEQHAIGVAVVGIGAFGAEGGDLDGFISINNGYRTVLRSCFMHCHATCQARFARLLPVGVGGNVGIVGRNAAKGVAHEAADNPCLKTAFLQSVDDGAHRCGKLGKHPVGFDMWCIIERHDSSFRYEYVSVYGFGGDSCVHTGDMS